ncbi:MAG: hypothetical protein HYV13_00705 [Candidatus Doudnabacteria bacterium]|nr:hypothetical protein [Candidatus Doudnabacteria bacterium]
MDKQLARSLSKLTALKNNLPKSHVQGKYANEFNDCIKELAVASGEDLHDFTIPQSEIKPRLVMSGPERKIYSSEIYVDREFY